MRAKKALRSDVMDAAKKYGNLWDDELEDKLNAEKQALPDVYIKMGIIKEIDEMERAFQDAQRNKAYNCGVLDDLDVEKCKISLMPLWDRAKNMVLEQIPMRKMEDRIPRAYKAFMMLNDLEHHPEKYGFEDCLRMKDFLLDRLHKMNITNLLINPGNPFDDFFEN